MIRPLTEKLRFCWAGCTTLPSSVAASTAWRSPAMGPGGGFRCSSARRATLAAVPRRRPPSSFNTVASASPRGSAAWRHARGGRRARDSDARRAPSGAAGHLPHPPHHERQWSETAVRLGLFAFDHVARASLPRSRRFDLEHERAHRGGGLLQPHFCDRLRLRRLQWSMTKPAGTS